MTDRPGLVLLCGLMCDARVWAPQCQAFADTFDLLPVDFPNLDSLDAMAGKVLALAPPVFALAGHSMGGRVALEVFRRAPERIARLALLDTGAHPGGESEVAGRMALVELGYRQGMKAVADAWLPPMVAVANRSNTAMMDDLVDMICSATAASFEAQQRALIARPDAFPLLRTVRCPTLVATGRFDDWSPVAQHEEMAREIPGSNLVVFEESGHMCTVETPDCVTRAFRDWLA